MLKPNPFCTSFVYSEAIGYEEGITRRDPSPVIRVGKLYYVWYSKATADESGYYASVWYATSPDGHKWTEQGEALGKGGFGAWDENGVFTPTTLVAGGRFYLFYTAVPSPFDNDNGGMAATPTAIGVAAADSPEGPWEKYDKNPVLLPGEKCEFDSHRIDDACIIVRNKKYWLYYKGRQLGLTPRETKMGVAISENPTGPYVKYDSNPVISSGHEVCVWPHGTGVAALVSPTGPEGGTVQYSQDGLHFKVKGKIKPPAAPGPYRQDNYQEGWGPGIVWGICHNLSKDRPFLMRFDCRFKNEKS